MTDDDLTAIERRLAVAPDGWHPEMRALVAEVRRLRALPVIQTCGGCRHLGHPHDADLCMHRGRPHDNARTNYEDAPPQWCPLRKDRR